MQNNDRQPNVHELERLERLYERVAFADSDADADRKQDDLDAYVDELIEQGVCRFALLNAVGI